MEEDVEPTEEIIETMKHIYRMRANCYFESGKSSKRLLFQISACIGSNMGFKILVEQPNDWQIKLKQSKWPPHYQKISQKIVVKKSLKQFCFEGAPIINTGCSS
jgi:hypothetical protein